jgi:hypothetical protein
MCYSAGSDFVPVSVFPPALPAGRPAESVPAVAPELPPVEPAPEPPVGVFEALLPLVVAPAAPGPAAPVFSLVVSGAEPLPLVFPCVCESVLRVVAPPAPTPGSPPLRHPAPSTKAPPTTVMSKIEDFVFIPAH